VKNRGGEEGLEMNALYSSGGVYRSAPVSTLQPLLKGDRRNVFGSHFKAQRVVQRERCGVFRGNLRDGEVKAQALHPFKEQGKRRAGNPHAAQGGRDGNPIGKAVSLHAVNRDAARVLSVGADKESAASGVRFKRE